MRVLIVGGTGFVGSNLVSMLVAEKHEVILLMRPDSKSAQPTNPLVHVVTADASQVLNIEKTAIDAIVNVVGIIREFPSKGITFKKAHFDITKNLVDFARNNGVERFIFISALGVNPDGKTVYQKTKYDAEQYLINSRLSWTILRPSMIFGPNDQSINFFASMVKKLPVVPVIGNGNYRLQPVFIDDVCYALRLALSDNLYANRILEFGGPEIFTYNQLLDNLGRMLGRQTVAKIHLPVSLMRFNASLFGNFKWFPLTNDQITMLLEENYTDLDSYENLFRKKAMKFTEGLMKYLR